MTTRKSVSVDQGHLTLRVEIKILQNPACTATSALGEDRCINGQQKAPLMLRIGRYINEVHLHLQKQKKNDKKNEIQHWHKQINLAHVQCGSSILSGPIVQPAVGLRTLPKKS